MYPNYYEKKSNAAPNKFSAKQGLYCDTNSVNFFSRTGEAKFASGFNFWLFVGDLNQHYVGFLAVRKKISCQKEDRREKVKATESPKTDELVHQMN